MVQEGNESKESLCFKMGLLELSEKLGHQKLGEGLMTSRTCPSTYLGSFWVTHKEPLKGIEGPEH